MQSRRVLLLLCWFSSWERTDAFTVVARWHNGAVQTKPCKITIHNVSPPNYFYADYQKDDKENDENDDDEEETSNLTPPPAFNNNDDDDTHPLENDNDKDDNHAHQGAQDANEKAPSLTSPRVVNMDNDDKHPSSLPLGNVKEEEPTSSATTVVIVGGGWAGFSAADTLSQSHNVQVHILDASPRGPGGLAAGWQSAQGCPVEAGLHGFWREYRNTFQAMQRIGLNLDKVLTPYTPSVLMSVAGTVAVAPVLGEDDDTDNDAISFSDVITKLLATGGNPQQVLQTVAPLLPPPLDLALLADYNDTALTVQDRLSGLGLLGVWADFLNDNWHTYDNMSADTAFRHLAGVSPRLHDQLIAPLLHVLPMTPGYDCSAAAALLCFHTFALQSRGAFDVRWCRGSLTQAIFNPWTMMLRDRHVEIRGGAKVTQIVEQADEASTRYVVTINDDPDDTLVCDAVVLAVGATTAGRMVSHWKPFAATQQQDWTRWRGVTCVAVRLFMTPKLGQALQTHMTESPVVVCGPSVGNLPVLVETGFCLYDLQRLQDAFPLDNVWAFEVDFFRANDLADLPNDQVVDVTLQAVAAALEAPELFDDNDHIVDSSVLRARDAVTHFCVGSAAHSPPVRLSKGLYVCGDWVDRATGHASWSTEKSVVTGRQAAQAVAADFGLKCDVQIVEPAPDTTQLALLRRVASLVRRTTPGDTIPAAPWAVLSRLLGR